ncbi:MAG: FAD-dependent oxidoreductase [Halanaerobium sp.]|nr:FAD-dependent oxidoreductase [Halanaerobium sp.]
MDKKKILILGAGYAGISAAQKLDKLIGKDPQVEISLINQSPYHTLLTELHEVAGNRVGSDAVTVPLNGIFKKSHINLITDYIEDIDFEAKVLKSATEEYHYDYLVLGVGSKPAFYNIPGMEEHSFTLWSLEDALTIKEHVQEMFAEAAVETSPVERQKLLTFVVGGGGFTGVEMIGELMEWVPDLCEEYHVDPAEVKLVIVEALDQILPVLRDSLVRKAEEFLAERGVMVLTGSPITGVEPDKITLKKGEEEKTIHTRTLIWTGGVKANPCINDKDLEKARRGRLKVNDYLQIPQQEKVYAVGDVACFTTEDGSTLPALVEAALQAGENCAHNIVADLKGNAKEEFKPKLHGVMVSIGSKYALSNAMGIPMSSLPALGMKHMVNLHYLFGIGGFKLIFKYLHHEFLNERGLFSMIIDHFKVKTSVAWLVILRIILGIRLLSEGLTKINEGWLGSENVLVSGSSSVLWSAGTPDWYVNFAKAFIVPNFAIFQKAIVLGEIFIGFAFIFGIFTFLAALGALGMSANFIIGGLGAEGGIWEPIWLFFVSLTMLAGPGRAFGLDHYVMPFIFNNILKIKDPKRKDY